MVNRILIYISLTILIGQILPLMADNLETLEKFLKDPDSNWEKMNFQYPFNVNYEKEKMINLIKPIIKDGYNVISMNKHLLFLNKENQFETIQIRGLKNNTFMTFIFNSKGHCEGIVDSLRINEEELKKNYEKIDLIVNNPDTLYSQLYGHTNYGRHMPFLLQRIDLIKKNFNKGYRIVWDTWWEIHKKYLSHTIHIKSLENNTIVSFFFVKELEKWVLTSVNEVDCERCHVNKL